MGCLPMLLPMPVLFALYFVFQNTIEFRGVPFLWLPDISLRDPYFITPILMGLSMFLMSWIGMRNAPPNPQAKMMMFMMPVMLTVLFFNFASGLNLYYAVQNIAAIPQQWLLARERAKEAAPCDRRGSRHAGRRHRSDAASEPAGEWRVKITYIGHATLLLEIGGARILTDPNFDPQLGRILPRVSAPGIAHRRTAEARRDPADACARGSPVVRLARSAAAGHSALCASGGRPMATRQAVSSRRAACPAGCT